MIALASGTPPSPLIFPRSSITGLTGFAADVAAGCVGFASAGAGGALGGLAGAGAAPAEDATRYPAAVKARNTAITEAGLIGSLFSPGPLDDNPAPGAEPPRRS